MFPILPEIAFALSLRESQIAQLREPGASEDNRVTIPSILVNAPFLQGSEDVLNSALWHRPGTGNPAQGGNMVLAGHRFQFTSGPKTLYHLDKVKVGDDIMVSWEGEVYKYVVYEMVEVAPTAVEIEQETTNHILTIYTCTPLWSADQRLVIKAKPV